jgi:transcriptional regulator with XRE-family HTH domain
MNLKKGTLGERIKRIRGEVYQANFGKRLGVSQATVSAWERDDESRPPSADMYFRLASLSPPPEDQAFFLQKAGLSQEIIISAAEKLFADRSALPSKGEIFRVPTVERTATGNQDTGRFFPVPAHLLPSPASTIALIVHECCANRTLPAGDILLLDTSRTGTQKAASFLNQAVVVDINWEHERIGGTPMMSHDRGRHSSMFLRHVVSGNPFPEGLYMGHLRCKRQSVHRAGHGWSHWVVTLSWANHFEGESDEAAEHELQIGSWFQPYDETTKTPEGLRAFEAKMRRQAHEEIELEPHCAILGRVIAWFPAPRLSAGSKP